MQPVSPLISGLLTSMLLTSTQSTAQAVTQIFTNEKEYECQTYTS